MLIPWKKSSLNHFAGSLTSLLVAIGSLLAEARIDAAAPEFSGTLSATAIGTTSATLNAVVLPHSTEASVSFRLGIDFYYTLPIDQTPILAAGELPVTVSRTLSGLVPGKTYYYTAKAVYAGGSVTADGLTFTTKRLPIAVADSIDARSKQVAIDPRKNDIDRDSAGLEIVTFTQGAHGKVEAIGSPATNGVLAYTPDLAASGDDSFTYTLRGGSTATVTVRSLSTAVADIVLNNGQPLTFDALENDKTPHASRAIVSFTQGVHGKVFLTGGYLFTYLPAGGVAGDDQFTYTLSDQSIGLVTVRTAPITYQAGLDNSQPVPGESADTFFDHFGLPAAGPFSATMRTGTLAPLKAIFASSGFVRLREGGNAPGIEGARIAKLGAPSGHAAIATLALQRPAVTPANASVLYTGIESGNLKAAVQTGTAVPDLPGVFFRSITAFDGNGSSVFFLTTLSGKTINASNNVALCAVLEDGTVRVLVQKGWGYSDTRITVLATLTGAEGSLAEGRWRIDDHTIGVRMSFANKSQALFAIPDTAVKVMEWDRRASTRYTADLVDPPRMSLRISSYGLPAFSLTGVSYAAILPIDALGCTKENNAAVLNTPVDGLSTLLARKGDAVSALDGTIVAGVTFKSFFNPVSGSNGHAAFLATLAGEGVNARNDTALFIGAEKTAAKLIARTGEMAPGGGLWSRFTSLVLPDRKNVDALFTATLASSRTITRANNLGLWVSTNGGAPALLLRTGQQFVIHNVTRTISAFTAIVPAAGSIGAASGYADDGRIRVLAAFDDKSEAFIEIAFYSPPAAVAPPVLSEVCPGVLVP